MVDLSLDRYAHLDSAVHRWDARFKLIGLMGLIFAFSFVQDLRLLPFLFIITAIIFAISRLPFDFLLTRLKYPGIFLAAVAVVLPLFSGTTVLWQLGPLAIRQEGTLELLVIVVKFACILTLGIVLFGSAPFLTNIKALRALRLSPILTDIMLLTYRYIFEIGHDLRTMQMAMRLRHFQARRLSLHNLATLASLSGTLLVRSFEQSERIYKAMILRGYGLQAAGSGPAQRLFKAEPKDAAATAVMLILAAVVVIAEIILRQM